MIYTKKSEWKPVYSKDRKHMIMGRFNEGESEVIGMSISEWKLFLIEAQLAVKNADGEK